MYYFSNLHFYSKKKKNPCPASVDWQIKGIEFLKIAEVYLMTYGYSVCYKGSLSGQWEGSWVIQWVMLVKWVFRNNKWSH